MKKLNVVVAAGMIDRKLYSKIQPLIEMQEIEKLHLVRIEHFDHKGVINHNPKGIWSKHKALSELYRILSIVKLILFTRVDLLIGIGTIPHGIFINIIGKLLFKKTIILLMGNNDLYLTYPNRKFRQKLLFKLVSVSNYIGTRGTCSKQWLVDKGIDADKVFIPHNTFSFTEFYPMEQEKVYDLMYVGKVNFYKRVDLLVDTVDKLVNEHGHSNIKLGIIGDGKLMNEIKEYIKSKNLEKNIDILPQGDHKYLTEMLNKSKIFIMTSQGEGLPMVIVEAMSCGLPAVAFIDADIPDIVRHEYNGLLCKLHDIETMAANADILLTNTELYEKYASNALKIREEKEKEYSAEEINKLWYEVLNKVFKA